MSRVSNQDEIASVVVLVDPALLANILFLEFDEVVKILLAHCFEKIWID